MIVFRSSLKKLPVEILQAVMSSLDEASSLPSIILSCSAFYHAFKDAKSLIIQNILLNEFGPAVLPEAIITLHLATIPSIRTSDLRPHGKKPLLKKREQPAVTPTLQNAISLSRFHSYVRFFASDYVSRTLAKHPGSFAANGKREVTKTEVYRIQRVFYRFQMFCHIFPLRTVSSRTAEELRKEFFCSFSPWENAQLGCVNDYFYGIVSPAFNELVEHDIEWAQCQVDQFESPTTARFQHFLIRGLPGLYDIAKAQIYEDKMKLLFSAYPRSDGQFLYWGLANSAVEADEDDAFEELKDMDASQRKQFILASFCEEEDTGPMHAWFGAHAMDNLDGWQYSRKRRAKFHREWGYVMWDRKRIDDWTLVNGLTFFDREKGRQIEKSEYSAWKAVRDSWRRRAYIHMAGGRGWWSVDDESKVVWTGRGSPWDDVKKRAQCEYCIGGVSCAPHRTVLRIPGVAREVEDLTLSGNFSEIKPPQEPRIAKPGWLLQIR